MVRSAIIRLLAVGLLAAVPSLGFGGESISFTREVVNVEVGKGYLSPSPPATVRSAPVGPELWFGEIARQLPEDGANSRAHYVPFAVEFRDSVVARAWCDENINGDLTDDQPSALYAVAGTSRSRCFLVHLTWTASGTLVDWTLRVLVGEAGRAPSFRVQSVYGMLGNRNLGGRSHGVLLLDANRDGLFTLGRSDGMLFDTDGDRHFTIDIMGPEFGPLAMPFTVSGRRYRALGVDPQGRTAVLEDIGPGSASDPPLIGRMAPPFEFIDAEGHPVDPAGRPTLVYFWGSWCGSCERQAEDLYSLYERLRAQGIEILAVSYDTDRSAMEAFRARHRHTWPNSFYGGLPAEDPVGRAFREAGAGVFYVIAPNGILLGREYDLAQVETLLAPVLRVGSAGN